MRFKTDRFNQPKKPLALLDVDNTLVDSRSTLNTALIDSLKAFGIQEICLFTSMSTNTVLQEHLSPLTRYALIELLEAQGFRVHAVITPIDPVYSQNPGAAYSDLLKPLYENMLSHRTPLEIFSQDLTYQITRLAWAIHNIKMDLVNHIIKGTFESDYHNLITYLEENLHQEIQHITTFQTTPNLMMSNEQKQKLVDIAASCQDICSSLNEMKAIQHGEEKSFDPKEDVSSASRVIQYILDRPWVQDLSWITQLGIDEGVVYAPWDKGSMYAYVAQNPIIQSNFDAFIYFDDKQACLDTATKINHSLTTKDPRSVPLYTIKVNPQFTQEKPGYYEESLTSIPSLERAELYRIKRDLSKEIEKEMADLLQRKRVQTVAALREDVQARYRVLATLQQDIQNITKDVDITQKNWKKHYQTALVARISTSLMDNQLDKYSSLEKLGITLLNIIHGILFFSPFIKKGITHTWFYSYEGKSKEAVSRTLAHAQAMPCKTDKDSPLEGKEVKYAESDEAILPTIIFGELHNDPITREVLAALVPELRSLGYTSYYDEMPEGCSYEIRLQDAQRQIALFEQYKEEMDARQLDIHSPTDRMTFFSLIILENPKQCKHYSSEMDKLANMIGTYSSLLAEQKFLIALSHANTQYTPIDLGRNLDAEILDNKARDKAFSHTYSQSSSVFGRIGLGHVSSIQQQLSALPSAANKDFIFFHIFSPPPTSNDPSQQICWGFSGGSTNYSSLQDYPFGITRIDAAKQSVQEIVAGILEQIQSRITEHSARATQFDGRYEQILRI